ncbi:hypothetical protein [Helicobacter burdigaliensis]|nr:hypothetical protein [Helicobacter burdigaliensis]
MDLHCTSFVDSLTCMLWHNAPCNDKQSDKLYIKSINIKNI